MSEEEGPTEAAGEPSVFGEDPPRGTYFFGRDLVIARKRENRRAGGVLRDYLSLCLDRRRLVNPEHYFKFRLYECERDPEKKLHDYIDPVDRRALNVAINRYSQAGGVFEQKFYFESLLRQLELPVTDTLGVVTNPGTSFHRSIGSVEALEGLLAEAPFPLFGKPINGSLSKGVVVVEGYDAPTRTLHLHGGERVPSSEFLRQVQERYGEYGYLLQRKLEPHPAMRELCGDAIGSVRVVTLTEDSRTAPLYAVWKIPSVTAVADNFWRAGNVIAHVDVDTGEVLACQLGSGTAGRAIEDHPETGARLLGFVLPEWSRTCRLAVDAASALYSVGVIGWDIAVTADGPVLIEGNNNPDHGMLQTAADRGLYSMDAGRALVRAREAAERRAKSRARDEKRRKRELIRERRQQALAEGFKVRGPDGGTA